MCFDRELPASFVVEVAERLERDGVDQLWVIEDCFYTAGISLAATALARTERLTVGLGTRNPAVTAMELATLANLAPGRLLAGIGHGVQDWMGQMGERTLSPLTTFEEVLTVVGRLLRGETVSFDGQEVTMSDVALDAQPSTVPPLLAGVRGPKSLALAGRIADGLVLAEGAGPTYVAQSIAHAGEPDPFRVSVFTALCVHDDANVARRIMAPFVCGMLADPGPAPLAHPHIEEIQARFTERGEDGIADMPGEWWIELGAIGSFDDALAHIEALADAGAHDVALFAGPKVEHVREDFDHVANLAAALR